MALREVKRKSSGKDELSVSMDAINSAKTELLEWNNKIDSSKQEIISLENQINNLRETLSSLDAERASALDSINKEKESLTSTNNQLNSSNNSLKNDIRLLEGEKLAILATIDSYRDTAKVLEKELFNIQRNRGEANDSLAKVLQEVNKANDKNKALEEDIKKNELRLSQYQTEFHNAEKQIASKKLQFSDISAEITQKNNEVTAINSAIATLGVTKSIKEQEIVDLDKKIDEKTTDFNILLEKAASLKRKEDNLNRLSTRLQELYKKVGVDITNELN